MNADSPTEAAKSKFGSIEIGRGVAAALVVLHHTGNMMAQPRFYDAEPFGGHFRNFNVGVDFFFVLSGFIIAWIHWDDIGRRDRLGSYIRKRFLRIYPPYWGVLFPLIALYLLFPNAGIPSQRDPANIIMSIFLLPYTDQPVLGVAWTLTHEIFFYFIFALIVILGRKALLILPIWAASIIACHLFGRLEYPFSFILNPFNLEFIMGVCAAIVLRYWKIPSPSLVLAAGLVIFMGFMLLATNIQDDPLIGRVAFGVPSLFFVIGAVEIERTRKRTIPSILLLLGASSYAIYLVHPVALSLGVKFLKAAAGSSLGLAVSAMIIAAIGWSAGFLYFALVEKRLVVIFRKAISPDRKAELYDRRA